MHTHFYWISTAPIVAALSLFTPPASANPISAIAKLAKAAKGAKAVGAGAKAAKVVKASSTVKALALGGTILAAERAGMLFRLVPDEAGRFATYLTRTPEGELLSIGRNMDEVRGLSAIERAGSAADVYIDLPAALNSNALDAVSEARLFALDAHGKAVAVQRIKNGDVVDLVVDGADAAMTVTEFALDQLANQGGPPEEIPHLFAVPLLPARCANGVREELGSAIPGDLKDFSAESVRAYLASTREEPVAVLTVEEAQPRAFVESMMGGANQILIGVIAEPCTPKALASALSSFSMARQMGVNVPFLKEPALRLETWTRNEVLAGFGTFSQPIASLHALGVVIPFRELSPSETSSDEVPLYFKLLGGGAILGFVVWKYRSARKRRKESEKPQESSDQE